MNSCQPYADRLVDLVYELLDEEEAEEVRRHVDGCEDCSHRVERLMAEQKLLAKAAKIYRDVRAFEKPSVPFEAAERRATVREKAAPSTTTSPHRPIRRWLAWAVAAAVLLTLGVTYGMYQRRLGTLASELESARNKLASLDSEIAATLDRLQEGKKQLPERLKEEVIQLAAMGPASVRPGQRQSVRVQVKDFSGAPAFARLTARLLDKRSKRELLKASTSAVNGAAELPLTIPETVAAGNAELELSATTAYARQVLAQEVKIEPLAYRLHLSLNKPEYHAGELMFFRVVILDTATHRPPSVPMRLYAALVDSKGVEVQRWIGLSDGYGVAAGELALPASLPGGEYALTVRPLETEQSVEVVPAKQAFAIRSVDEPQLALPRTSYFPGETIEAACRLSHAAGQPRKLSVELVPAGPKSREKRRSLASGTIQLGKSSSTRVRLVIPHDAPPGEYDLAVGYGKAGLRLRQRIAVLPVPLIELFPEGGNLVADVPNRVYYRITVPRSERGDPSLRISDANGTLRQGVAVEHRIETSWSRVFLGTFEITPRQQQQLVFTAALQGKPPVRRPAPEIAPTGVALRVSNVVDREGEAMRATVYSSGRGRRLLVTVAKDGNVIDQRDLWATADGTAVELAAPQGVSAVTVYELQPSGAVPMAERLVYRAPSRYLDLTARVESKPDRKLHVDIRITDEAKKAVAARLGINVGDERVLQVGRYRQASLPAFFLLAGSPLPGDLESSVLFLREGQKEARQFEYFLSIDGWRRFGQLPKGNTQWVDASPVRETRVFVTDNRDQAERTYRERLKSALENLILKTVDQHQQLTQQRETEASRVAALAAAVRDYRQLPGRYLMAGLGLALLLSLAAGVLLLMYGGYRVLRRESPTGAFASAFVTLLVCLVVYGISRHWTVLPVPVDDATTRVVERTPPPVPMIDVDRVVDLFARGNARNVTGTLKLAHARPQPIEADRETAVAMDVSPTNKMRVASADLATDLQSDFSAADFLGISRSVRYRSAQSRQAMLGRLLKKSVRSSPLMTPGGKGASPPSVRPGIAVPSVSPPAGAIPAPHGRPEGASQPKKDQAPAAGAFAPKLGMGRGAANQIDARYFRIFSQPSDYRYRRADGTPLSWGTLLWLPNARCDKGQFTTAVETPAGNGRYRVLIAGHTRDGRLGCTVTTVTVVPRR